MSKNIEVIGECKNTNLDGSGEPKRTTTMSATTQSTAHTTCTTCGAVHDNGPECNGVASTRGKIVLGHGRAREWAIHASAVERDDADLLSAVRATRMFDLAQREGYADRHGTLLGDAWLVVADVADDDLDHDPAVIAYCDAPRVTDPPPGPPPARNIEVIGECKNTNLDDKRFYLPGIVIKSTCPKCGTAWSLDLKGNYLSHPIVGKPFNVGGYCCTCDHEWPVMVLLKITVEPA